MQPKTIIIYAMAEKNLNRIKVMLAEKGKRTNGLQRNLAETKQPFPNGVLMLVNHL